MRKHNQRGNSTPERNGGRPMGTAAGKSKPPILPGKIAEVLRGERGYTENCKDIVELSIYHYQDGKAGRSYVPAEAPGFSPHVVAKVECFLLACWVQGRRDAMEVPT